MTILGIILFLRLGFVVGNAGLRNALVMIGVASGVSLLTSLSLAAIATNIEVKGGGDYYLISRTLGVEFGGGIGVVLFLAQSVSIAFYAIGFGEAVAGLAGWEGAAVQAVAAVAVLGLFVLAWMGADAATRFQFIVMALLILALTSFYAGAVGRFDPAILAVAWSPPRSTYGFWALFAILFPAVTGFTQGVSMSGDLRDPGRSLPRGTFAAVGLSTVVYVSVAVLLAGSVALSVLASDVGAMKRVALVGPLIDVGLIAATLSSAMASFLGAPRILQSLAADRVFPALKPFATGHGPANNPRRGVLASLVIALGTVAIGSLNLVATVVSMFFLISYGLLNYATFYEARAASPSFRPRFRFFDKRASLLGAVACLGAMMAINPGAGAAAVVIMYGIYRYLGRPGRPERWADASHSHYFQRAKEALGQLAAEGEHPRNWRPQILAFSADPGRRERLLRFATWLEGGSGLTAVARVVVGSGAVKRKERADEQARLVAEVEQLGLDVHPTVVLAPDALEALPIIVQSFGIGPLRANTVLFGLPEQPDDDRLETFVQTVTDVARLGVNVVCMSSDPARWERLESIPGRKRRIDVWWFDDSGSELALLMAYLVTRNPAWSKASIRVIARVTSEEDRDRRRAALAEMLEEVRIPAEIAVLEQPDLTRISALCQDAALVLVPMRSRRGSLLDSAGDPIVGIFEHLPMAAAVLTAQPIDLAAGPDTGYHGDLMAAEERLEGAERRLRILEDKLARLELEVSDLRAEADRSGNGAAEPDLAAAEEELETTLRRTLKARAAVDAARADVERLLARR